MKLVARAIALTSSVDVCLSDRICAVESVASERDVIALSVFVVESPFPETELIGL